MMAPLQRDFHARWPMLRNPHVRALAWLLTAPDLLDAQAPRWEGRIAQLPADTRRAGLQAAISTDSPAGARSASTTAQTSASTSPSTWPSAIGAQQVDRDWLLQLDREPQALEAFLNVHRFTRLGRYAENLLEWNFRHRGVLYAHGLQVRTPRAEGGEDTVGEFDFLLDLDAGLTHWELATKFYLLCSDDPAVQDVQQADYFVGPNLADTLGRKMRKILDRQLALGRHPAAASLLPRPLAAAQALVKGWLFYRRSDAAPGIDTGISAAHCRGWWCVLSELEAHAGPQVALLSRLEWLSPARLPAERVMTPQQAVDQLAQGFANDGMPVMAVSLLQDGDAWVEADRGFVVPDQWQLDALRRTKE